MSQNNADLLQPNKTHIQGRIIDNLSYGKEEETRNLGVHDALHLDPLGLHQQNPLVSYQCSTQTHNTLSLQ